MDSRYKHKIGQEVANSAPTPVTPTDDSKEVVNVEYLHGKALSKTDNIQNLWTGTQAEYDALTPDANTLYFIQ